MIIIRKFSKSLNIENILIGISQIVGIITFTIIIYFSNEKNLKLLSLYVAAQAAASFIVLSIQFSKKRQSVLSHKFCFFLLLYFTSIFLIYNGVTDYPKIFELIIILNFFLVTFVQLAITSIEKYKTLLLFQIFISFLLPLSIFFPIIIFVSLILITLLVIKKFKIYYLFSIKKPFLSDTKTWFFSFCMQSPFILYPFFDPILASRLDIKFYGFYLLVSKYIFGIGNFIYSFIQFQIIKGKKFNVKYIPLILLLLNIVGIVLLMLETSLIFQIVVLVNVINLGSIFMRSYSNLNINKFIGIIPILSIFIYYLNLVFLPDEFFGSYPFFILLITLSTSLPILIIKYLGITVKN